MPPPIPLGCVNQAWMPIFNRTQNPPFCEETSISSEYGTMQTSYSKNNSNDRPMVRYLL